MRASKIIGIVLTVIGIILIVISLAADSLGLGSTPGFGYKQSLGSVLGGFVTAAGFYWASGSRKDTGGLLLLGGLVLLVASLTADLLGLGVSSGFGYNQLIGSVTGAVAALIGFLLFSRK